MERTSKRKLIIIIVAIVAVIGIGVGVFFGSANMRAYSAAEKSLNAGEYQTAIDGFAVLEDYKDSQSMVLKATYGLAKQQMDQENYSDAMATFEDLGEYEDAADLAVECQYQLALHAYRDGDLDGAIAMLLELPELDKAVEQLHAYQYEKAQNLFEQEAYADAEALFIELGDYEEAAEFAEQSAYLQTVDGQFLKTLKEGLEARWDFLQSDDVYELSEMEQQEKAIFIEQEKLLDFRNKAFDDNRLGEIAEAYIESLEVGNEALKYYNVDYLQYSDKWDGARANRTHLLEELVSDYDFSVEDKYAKELADLVSDSQVYSEQEQLKTAIHEMADNAVLSASPFIDDYSGDVLWYDYSIALTNTTEATLEYFYVDIQVLDTDGNIVAQGGCDQITSFQPGQSATVNAYIVDSEFDVSGFALQFVPHYSVGTLYE